MDEENELKVELLKDTLNDLRNQNKFIKNLVKLLCVIIGLFILAFSGLFIYSHERFVKFVLDYDVSITSSITLDNNSQNEGNIEVDIQREKTILSVFSLFLFERYTEWLVTVRFTRLRFGQQV